MSFSASLIEVQVRYSLFGKPNMNRQFHTWDGAAVAAATPEQVGEAFWNDVKVRMRAIMPNATDQMFFTEVFVREVSPSGVYGAYAVPVGERAGTRGAVSAANIMPSSNAGSVKQTVGSSTTKPGGKRHSPLLDTDVEANQVLGAAYLALLDDWAEAWCDVHVLGAPVATGVLEPVIVRFTGDTPTAWQAVTGWSLKNLVSTQLTRKVKPV